MKLINFLFSYKKALVLLILLVLGFTSFGQEGKTQNDSSSKNVIKLNILYTVFDAIEISYDRNLSSNLTVGFSYSQYFEKKEFHEFPYRNIGVSFRSYFMNKKEHQGFYLEYGLSHFTMVELKYGYVEEENLTRYYSNDNEVVSAIASNLVAGGKFVRKGGFIGEVEFGVTKPHSGDIGEFTYPKAAIRLGYTF